MINSVMAVELRNYTKYRDSLKRILRDTQHSLEDIKNNDLLGKEIKDNLFSSTLIDSLTNTLERCPVILIMGQNCHAKALFVNVILEQPILPLYSNKWRWIKFAFGNTKSIRLTLGHEFEIVEKMKAHEEPWITLPDQDIRRGLSESPLDHCPTVEVEINNSFLQSNVNILITPDCSSDELSDLLTKNLESNLPCILYCICDDVLSDTNIHEIRVIKEKFPELPILFIYVLDGQISSKTESLTESEQHLLENGEDDVRLKKLNIVKNQLIRLGCLNDDTNNKSRDMKRSLCTDCSLDNSLISESDIHLFHSFFQDVLKLNLMKMSALLSEIHNRCLRVFILSVFDMAREIQITPRRMKYAQDVELKLCNTLMKIASEKQEEISKIIQVTLQQMKANTNQVLEDFNYNARQENCSHLQSAKMATMELQQLVLKKLSSSVAQQLVKSIGCLRESFTGTLQRCLESLEKSCHESEGSLTASDAVKQILSAAYNVDLKTTTSFSVVQSFMERLRNLVHNFQFPWSTCAERQFDSQWQLQVIVDVIDSLSASKLAKTICTQFQEHVKSAHESFESAMRSLENQLSGQLEQTEEQRIAIRKRHAPRFARLALESTSLCDLVRWGTPKQIREIGRGQYGVVFACEPWGGVNPCAVKSVVPPDDRHWNDLAMEFYYTRTMSEHPRIVKLRGSVIDYTYGGGNSSAVLLVMERMTRDLYCGLRSGLSWVKRLQIAIDVVEGIRYLHSQGLVHRDIKLKNVLLDAEDRAKLTDFGFCIPEAMMSGSIVGTPVHMAPELLSGRYDSSVDVYAFGILFWYICAGQVRLPYHFENFHNKEQLWNSVRKGMRPERLQHFDQSCWKLMEQCWAAKPSLRPLLGHVQPQLEAIQERALKEDPEDAH